MSLTRAIIVDDPIVAQLAGDFHRAATLGHSGRSFLEHLVGTWRILADWGMPAAVCRAGFMHSAYATSFYPHALLRLNERHALRRTIGREAEELVYRFCTMDRRGFWDHLASRPRQRVITYPDRLHSGAPVSVGRRTVKRLLVIESANIAEQSKAPDGGPAPWMCRVLRWWEFLDLRSIPLRLSMRPKLSRRADEAAIEAYRTALTLPLARATVLLDRSVRQNPWAAEARILRALCALEQSDERARLDAQAGARLLSAWATPWDKRLTVNGWGALAKRIETAGFGRRRSLPRFDRICAALEKRAAMPRWLGA
jgi:hypothetical protein